MRPCGAFPRLMSAGAAEAPECEGPGRAPDCNLTPATSPSVGLRLAPLKPPQLPQVQPPGLRGVAKSPAAPGQRKCCTAPSTSMSKLSQSMPHFLAKRPYLLMEHVEPSTICLFHCIQHPITFPTIVRTLSNDNNTQWHYS